MSDDQTLLLSYASSRDAEAFAQLVKRYTALVFSVASRVTGNSATAEDVTQDCFFALARQAASIRGSLPGWLHRVALNRSMQVARNEARRQRHEEKVLLPSPADYESNWNQIAPFIDAALGKLPDELREPLVQHFLLGRKQTKIAKHLGIDQATVSRRLHEGIERLREHLKQTGVVCGSIALSTVLVKNAFAAVPVRLTASLAKMALAGPATVAATASTAAIPSHGGLNLTLIKGALKLVTLIKLKTAIVACVVTIMAAGTTAVVVQQTGKSLIGVESSAKGSDLSGGGVSAQAETLLRYKFTPGETPRYVISQDQTFTITRQDNDEISNITKNTIVDMIDKVEAIDSKGNASITVLMDRVRMIVKESRVVTLDYDTASHEKPKGSAKILAMIYDVLTKRPFTIKESPLGKISNVKPPEGLNEALKKTSNVAAQINDTVPSEDELSDPIKNGNGIIFPEGPVSVGKTWSLNEDKKYYIRMGHYAAESVQTITTTFRYLGKENKDGKNLDKISVSETLRSPGTIKSVELKSLSTEGTLYFDNITGAVVDYNSHCEMKMAVTANNNGEKVKISMVFTSVNTTKLVPTDSKAEKGK